MRKLQDYDIGTGNTGQVVQLPIEQIRAGFGQMRMVFDSDALDELAASIKSTGLIQPVVVRSCPGGYELLAGERRWRAAQRAGLHELSAIIRDDIDDREAVVLGLIENLQREQLSPMETAHGLKELSEQLELTHAETAARLGKSRVYVTNFLRLLNLSEKVQNEVNSGKLSMGHARALATLPEAEQEVFCRRCISHGWSVRLLETKLRGKRETQPRTGSQSEWSRLARELTDLLGNKVDLQGNEKGKGELKIRFHSFAELDGLLERMGYSESDY